MDKTQELDNQLNSPSDDEEPEETGEENEDKENEETEQGESEKESEEENDEEEEEAEFEMPDKFKGKTPEEIAKSHIELEKMIDKKAQEKAEEIAKKKKEDDAEKEEDEEDEKEPEETKKEDKVDFSKMTPEQFADWVDKRIDEKAESKAKKIYSDSSKLKTTVNSEIAEARKNHPLLKKDKDYTELVLAIVEAASSKGKTITLKEACGKVEGLIGKKKDVEKEDETKMKQAKAQVETGSESGAASGGKETEEEKIKQGMLKQSQTGDLGGL